MWCSGISVWFCAGIDVGVELVSDVWFGENIDVDVVEGYGVSKDFVCRVLTFSFFFSFRNFCISGV